MVNIFLTLKDIEDLLENLFILTITKLVLSFAVGIVSQFMQTPYIDHWTISIDILRYLKKAPRQYENKGNTQISGCYDVNWARFLMD